MRGGLAGFYYNICCTLRRVGPSGFEDNIFCTLLAAVRQPASAGCRAAARWVIACSDDTMFYHLLAAVWQLASSGCWRVPPTIGPPPRPRIGSQLPIRAQSISWAQHLNLQPSLENPSPARLGCFQIFCCHKLDPPPNPTPRG